MYLRAEKVGLIMVTLSVVSLVFAGCGRQGAPSGKVEMTMKETAETQAQKEEVPMPSTAPITEERTYYDFESDLNGWEVPQWALGKSDYVASDAQVSPEVASKGKSSMMFKVDFPGNQWTAGLVEIQQFLNMSKYRVIRADIYLPPDAPVGLKAKLILTVGDNWKFVEMSRSIPLIPGEWATITANIEPGSYDWKRVVPDETFAEDVRKIAVRIESNRKPVYTGYIFLDNVRVGR